MIRRVVLAVLIAATSFALIPGSPAQARACRIGWQCTTNYYSDAAHTQLVGGKAEDCDGTSRTWGTRTGYLTFVEYPC